MSPGIGIEFFREKLSLKLTSNIKKRKRSAQVLIIIEMRKNINNLHSNNFKCRLCQGSI